MAGASFVSDLMKAVPELKLDYDEHLKDNEELLPHAFMGDVTRFALRLAGEADQREVLKRLLDRMEWGLRFGDEKSQEMIVDSFVENLMGKEEGIRLMVPLMGPLLRDWVKKVTGL